jgi:FkbM family methyltransferase
MRKARKIRMRYYSEHGQDQYLDEVIFKGKRGGTFIEVGAGDGVFLSNTYFLETQRSWGGVCIEPRRSQFARLKANRSCVCLSLCVSSSPGMEMFTEFKGKFLPPLSGLARNFHPEHRAKVAEGLGYAGMHYVERYRIATETLSNIIASQGLGAVEYCSIDVEGSEMDVLTGIDFGAARISVLSIENNYSNPAIDAFMKSAGYTLVHEMGEPGVAFDQIFVAEFAK